MCIRDSLYTTAAFGGPFRSWAQFNAFLAAHATATGIITPAEHGLVLALAHGEARHMGYNPDVSRRLGEELFDKLSITKSTTTLSIVAAGILEVRATGWITGAPLDDPNHVSEFLCKVQNTIQLGVDADACPSCGTALGTGPNHSRRPLVLGEAELDRVVRVFLPMFVSSQEDLEAAWKDTYPDRSVYQSMPEIMPRSEITDSADPVDGHIRLTTETTVTGGLAAYSTAFRNSAGPAAPYVGSRASKTCLLYTSDAADE